MFDLAADRRRVIVSTETEFGAILAGRSTATPSLVLFGRQTGRRPAAQGAVLLAHLPAVEHDLAHGAVVVIEEARVRVRRLPIGQQQK